ncbi:MAG: class I SAM-dependent RNA methyltransferase, partial [Clostridia bacterium]|nr:class I SAM-dependent RNA methyltransferase [Clostridia bacterium]
MMLRYTATCLFGLEGLLGEEIEALGCRRIENIDGRITFEGDETTAARASIALRFAERLYLNLGAFEATTFTALFDGTKALPWEDFIGRDDEFPVTGHAVKSKLFSVPDCQKIVKKAVSVRLGEHYGLERLPETGTKYRIEFFLFKDRANLMIDLSGVPLHKRGYRPETVDAPIRETLAAAMVKLARPREDVLLWDPFCGSGTIAIEAAMQMLGIAPGLRRSFAAEDYPAFPASSWKDAREAAQAAIKRDSAFEAYATDIDPKCVEIATATAERAGVKDHVNVFQ